MLFGSGRASGPAQCGNCAADQRINVVATRCGFPALTTHGLSHRFFPCTPPQEREAGWIRGSVNIPSAAFLSGDAAKLDEAIAGPIAAAGADVAVVHCHFCSSRGPRSSRALAARMAELGVTTPRVTFLTGGVATFLNNFSTDEELAVVPPGGWDPTPKH